MKKVQINKQSIDQTVRALDEVELAVFGKRTGFRTSIKAGAEGGGLGGCKPGMCPIPMYGVSLPDPFDL